MNSDPLNLSASDHSESTSATMVSSSDHVSTPGPVSESSSSSTTSSSSRPQSIRSMMKAARAGAIAGAAGGVPFGIMMAVMGMLPMVAALVGSSMAGVGLGVHLVISALIGAPFGVVAMKATQSARGTLLLGVANGVLWWGLGALILMPLGLGMPENVFAIGPPQLMSLVGHLVFGAVSGIAFHKIWR